MGPLDGIHVLDLSRLAPGPYCSMLLGDLGAEVIRVDHPTGEVRTADMLARNKRAIAIDLKQAEGQRVLHSLCRRADVLLESNRPGVSRRLAADYATVQALNPAVVYCSLTGYGQSGPLAAAAGHDINYLAIAGVLSQLSDGREPPRPPVNLLADFGGGGLLAAFGIVCALFERTRSGRGQFIDAAMIDGSASLMSAHYANGGRRSAPGKGVLSGAAPFYRCYECQDGGYVAVGAIEPKFFAALCQGTELDELVEMQLNEERWPQMSSRFAARFRDKTRDQWAAIFTRLDACVAPVLELDEAPRHPHQLARQGFLTVASGRLHVTPAPRLERTPGAVRREEPGRGEHTDEILAELGYGASEIAALRANGAVV